MTSLWPRIEPLLTKVEKPGRYVGGELGARSPRHEPGRVAWLLVYPDTYEIGLPNQGLQILYEILNERDDATAERAYAPWVDLEGLMRAEGIPLFSVESHRPAMAFDVIGFNLSAELTYTNVLNLIDLAGLPLRTPAAIHGRAGMFCYDTMTLVGPGSWEAIRAAADCARTAAELVASGQSAAYALCRPPGHHASRSGYGGSCYLNNAAIAAQALRAAGIDRVAVLDIDAHHGNGTQSIFYGRPDVFYGSVHVDPGAGWFPHYLGFADERGEGQGLGANQNIPLAPGSGDERWLDAVGQLCAQVRTAGADAVVLSLGVDAAAADPESPLEVTADGYRAAGALIGALGPVAVIQEGGYDLASLGDYVVAALSGLQAGQAATAAG